jgi:hypothetical protein
MATPETTSTAPDRAAIRAAWETMRRDFHALVDSLTDHQWNQQSISTRWSNGELLTHFVVSLGLFPKELACARQGKSFVNLPGTIMNPLNYLLVRTAALRFKRQALKERFESYYARGLHEIDNIRDDEWRKGAHFFGEGYRDIEALCYLHPHHFEEHGRQVRQGTADSREKQHG